MIEPLNENTFCKEHGFIKNEHGVYLYVSKNGEDAFNLTAVLEDYKEWIIKNKIVSE